MAGRTLAWLDLRRHDYVGTLDIEHDLARLPVLYDDSHTLGLRAEREVLQDVVLLGLAARVHKLNV